MTEARDGKKENMILTLILWCVLCTICMALMLKVAAEKVVVIADVNEMQSELTNMQNQELFPSGELRLMEMQPSDRMLQIPLENGIKAEHIVMENRYVEKQLWIYIQKASDSFYNDNVITGDISQVENGWYEVQEERVVLKLAMSDVYEYRSTLESGSLQLQLLHPHEVYQQIVVVDPVGGGKDSGITIEGFSEKELTVQVAKLLSKKVTDSNIKVYFTRTEDENISLEKRMALVEAVDADLYVGLCASENAADDSVYGIQSFYNDAYFLPGFGNIEWADLVTKKVTIAASNRALGLLPVQAQSMLKMLEIPATQVSLGFLTNQQEAQLLQQESYQEKLAQGIADAILEAYTSIENVKQVENEK